VTVAFHASGDIALAVCGALVAAVVWLAIGVARNSERIARLEALVELLLRRDRPVRPGK
jgi:hypothetical protein